MCIPKQAGLLLWDPNDFCHLVFASTKYLEATVGYDPLESVILIHITEIQQKNFLGKKRKEYKNAILVFLFVFVYFHFFFCQWLTQPSVCSLQAKKEEPVKGCSSFCSTDWLHTLFSLVFRLLHFASFNELWADRIFSKL